jgi:hypothetical protein
MKRTILILIAAAFSCLGADEPGFVSLFNGQNLEGWVNVNCAPETWSVRNSVIACTGKPTGAMRTTRQYENFILELEWRHLANAGNAGVFIWSSPIAAKGVPFLRAIEVQVLDNGYGNSESHTTHGDVFPIHGSTMKPFGEHRGSRSFPSERRSKSSPEWNHYRVVCDKGVLRLHVNGKEVSGGEECNYRKGYIGLESEGSPTEFRNIRIKELPPSGASPDMTAPVAQKWEHLYTGVDLRGWKAPSESRWRSEDWKLVLAKGGDTTTQTFWNERLYSNFELILDCRVVEKSADEEPSSGIRLRGRDGKEFTVPLSLLPAGKLSGFLPGPQLEATKWHRVTIQVKGSDVTVMLDDKKVGEGRLPSGAPARGAVGLMDNGRAMEFANFYVRPL